MDIFWVRILYGRGAPLRAVFIIAFCTLMIMTTGQANAAVPYSAAEQAYLKNITPTLYEFSQLANEVSASALTLQSAPAAECSGQFSYYRGLMGSFKNQLGGFDAPPRLQSVRIESVEAITDYENGLNLYGQACVEEDFGVKEGLVERGAEYMNTSVREMERVYAKIEKLTRTRPNVETSHKQEGAIIETQSVSTVVIKETDRKSAAVESEEDTPVVYEKPAREKTAEEIIREIEMEVKAKNEDLSKKTTATSQPVSETTQVTTPQTAPEATARGIEVAAPEIVERETAPIAVEESKTEVLEVEPYDKPSIPEVTAREEIQAETVQETQSAGDVKSKEEKISELNEKIMKSTSAGDNQGDAHQAAAPDTAATRTGGSVNPYVEDPAPESPAQEVEKSEEVTQIEEEETVAKTQTSQDEILQEEKIERINRKINERIKQRAHSQGDSVDVSSSPAGAETVIARSESEPDTMYSEAAPDEVAVSTPADREDRSMPEPDAEIQSWCTARMSTGPERENCIKSRSEAKNSMKKMVERYPPGTEAGDIIEKCKIDWKEGGTYNYEMVISCTQFFCKQKGIQGCAGAVQ